MLHTIKHPGRTVASLNFQNRILIEPVLIFTLCYQKRHKIILLETLVVISSFMQVKTDNDEKYLQTGLIILYLDSIIYFKSLNSGIFTLEPAGIVIITRLDM